MKKYPNDPLNIAVGTSTALDSLYFNLLSNTQMVIWVGTKLLYFDTNIIAYDKKH